jgi:hypothetical protein
MKNTFLFLALLMALVLVANSHARLNYAWSYEELLRLADLVVVATAITTKETTERTTIEKTRYNSINPPFKAVGLETTFSVQTILKGKLPEKTFVLHHYREANPSAQVNAGPMQVTFKSDKTIVYLLFLTRESDGRYAAVSGQIDPAFSIKRIQDVEGASIVFPSDPTK